jgi:alkyl sulfatase BDS1-like metallo-beta-lactamase superfamily hydrolase
MEQLGYQSESATWRNAYLTAALELRHGSLDLGPAPVSSVASALTGEQLIEALAVRFDPSRFRPAAASVWTIADLGETHLVGIANHAIHHRPSPPAETIAAADVAVTVDHEAMVKVIWDPGRLDSMLEANEIAVDSGDVGVLRELIGALDVFGTPAVIEPQPVEARSEARNASTER